MNIPACQGIWKPLSFYRRYFWHSWCPASVVSKKKSKKIKREKVERDFEFLFNGQDEVINPTMNFLSCFCFYPPVESKLPGRFDFIQNFLPISVTDTVGGTELSGKSEKIFQQAQNVGEKKTNQKVIFLGRVKLLASTRLIVDF